MPERADRPILRGALIVLFFVVLFFLMRVGAIIYPLAFTFVKNHINQGSEIQEVIAKLLTCTLQALELGSLGCAYWCLVRFEKDVPNAFFPALFGSIPMILISIVLMELIGGF